MCLCCESTLLWSIQSLPLLSFYFPPLIFQQLVVHIPVSSTLTDVMFHNITDALSFCLSLFLLVFVYFIFWIGLPYKRENIWPLCFWAWLTSLNMMSSNCIYLLPTTCHYSYGWVKLRCLDIPYLLDPFISCRALELFPKLGYCE
jgi:hypothetical protein